MRIPRRNIPTQPITHLWERHREIARRMIAGERQCDIAKSLGLTDSRLSIICNSPIFKNYISKLSLRREDYAIDVAKNLAHNAELGSAILNQILNSTKEAPVGLVAKVAMDALDRAGYPKVSISKTENINVTLTADKLEEIKRNRERLLNGLQSSIIPIGVES